MTSPISLHAIAQFSAERMLNCIVEGVAIALFAWLLLRVIGRRDLGLQNSGTRFAVWFAALFAIASVPFASVLVPVDTGVSSGISHPAVTVPGSWATYLFAMWALVATLGVLRVGVGLWQVRSVRKGCIEIDSEKLDPVLRLTLEEFRSTRSVKICVSETLQVPTAIGFVRPVVALPAWTIRELSSVELNAILLHELAHLRRWDDWTNLAQKLLRSLLFFHPAVWWIEGKLSLEREMACDDAVLAETANPRAYAECLVTVAEKSVMRRGLAMAQAAVSRMRQTTQRVAQILDKNRTGATRVWRPALGMVAAFAMACVGLLSQSPELISFHDKAPTMSASVVAMPMPAEVKSTSAPLVPVKFVVPGQQRHPVQVRRASEVPVKVAAQRIEAPLEATLEPSLADLNAVLVPVRFTETKVAKQEPQQFKSVVLVYQGLQYDDAGFAHWTVCVWRVNVPVDQPTLTTNPAKST